MIQKNFDDPQVSDSQRDISNECANFDDPKEFDDPQVFDDAKGISIESMDFDMYGDTSIFDGFVLQLCSYCFCP